MIVLPIPSAGPYSFSRALFFQPNGELVDLGGDDEIILGQPVRGMGRQLDRQIAKIDEMQIGMVVLVFGESGPLRQ